MLNLKLYNADNEIERELTRSFVPWGVLERALDLQDQFAELGQDERGVPTGITREHTQALTDFVVFVFDDAASADELKRKASLSDMLALYRQIFAMVQQSMPQNPTPALAKAQTDLKKVRQGRR